MSVPSFLSAIIVTNGRPDELDGVLANLLNQDRQPEEIIVVDNDPGKSARRAPHISDPLIRYLCPGEDLGLVKARNRAAETARGDILLFMADYVRFDKYHVTNTLMNAFRPSELGAMSFYVRNATSRELVPEEFPGQRLNQADKPRDICALSSCCHAIRHRVFADLNGYDENLFDGEEMLDLAVRAIKADWRIRYTPTIVVEYRATMRPPNITATGYRLVRNRIYYALKHLPIPFVITHALAWSARGLFAAVLEKEIGDYFAGFKAFKAEGLWQSALDYRKANPTTQKTTNYLMANEGHVIA